LPLLEQVLDKYPNDVRLVFKFFPLTSIHKMAMGAASAAFAAKEQGKFWEFHDKLFADNRKLSDQKFEEIAGRLKLNMEKFNQDRKSKKTQFAIQQNIREGAMAGVRGTPTIFINGRRLKKRNLAGFSAIIDDELHKVKREVKREK